MSYFDQSSLIKQNPATVLLPGFEVRCTLHSIGLMQTFLNDEIKPILTLYRASVRGLERGNPAASMSLPELYARKDQCHAIAFDQMLSQEETGLLPRGEPLAIYTSHYVVQGKAHLGTEDRVHDFIASTKAQFIGMTDVAFFPLFEPQTAMIQQAPLVFVYRDAVRMHHPV
ncbi:MAG: hypothetical protein AAGU78_09135 [Chloroflexota bacterium]|jgi:hypothetical protein|nr:hypothetical protein [Anaerolineae bacterium]HMM28432.1 hypothetical protein [Aggregatilineaceae bacterium]